MAHLRCEGLTRRPWFADVDLSVEAGEIVVVAGASGSGKTLFLRTLADLDPADSGRVLLGERASADVPPAAWRRRVLYLHQTPARLPGTVSDNVCRVLALRHCDGSETAGAPVVDGLDGESPVDRLSGGEVQRLALARSVLVSPDVLLLDEATSALDPDAAREQERRLVAWVAEGPPRAILWVSHDPALADRLGARVLPFPPSP